MLGPRVVAACADVVLANSREVAHHVRARQGCPPHKVRLLPNGIDIERYAAAGPLPDPGRPVVGTVIRLERIKGPDCFLEAAHRIAAEMPDVRFVVVGDGSLRPGLERQRAALGLEERLSFLGEREDITEVLLTLSVFVLPSDVEGMSMALLEAMAAGRPIVATGVGGNVNLIRHEETGLLVSPRQPGEMADAVLRLLKEPQWAARLGSAAQASARSRHCADAMVRELEAIYHDLLKAKGLCLP
jgi:glycosyltransferase involved in cell wall biosynthesis